MKHHHLNGGSHLDDMSSPAQRASPIHTNTRRASANSSSRPGNQRNQLMWNFESLINCLFNTLASTSSAQAARELAVQNALATGNVSTLLAAAAQVI